MILLALLAAIAGAFAELQAYRAVTHRVPSLPELSPRARRLAVAAIRVNAVATSVLALLFWLAFAPLGGLLAGAALYAWFAVALQVAAARAAAAAHVEEGSQR